MLGNYRVTSQQVTSRVAHSSAELAFQIISSHDLNVKRYDGMIFFQLHRKPLLHRTFSFTRECISADFELYDCTVH
jgi:hypothetical protein